MKFNCPYWGNETKMNLLQRWILVHSFIYYELNSSAVEDEMYDNNCKQLLEMKNKYPDDYKKTRYYDIMKDFGGETGFNLISKVKENDWLYKIIIMESYVVLKSVGR